MLILAACKRGTHAVSFPSAIAIYICPGINNLRRLLKALPRTKSMFSDNVGGPSSGKRALGTHAAGLFCSASWWAHVHHWTLDYQHVARAADSSESKWFVIKGVRCQSISLGKMES